MSSDKTLCQRLGGQPTIESVVNKFYAYMLQDPSVKDFFQNQDLTRQKQNQTYFITMITGGPNKYNGLDAKKAHEKFKIGKAHFDAAWVSLERSLHDHQVAGNLIGEVRDVFYSAYEEVVTV